MAGTPRRLFLIDRRQGRIHRWLERPDAPVGDGLWREVARIAPADLPRWAWSVAAFLDGCAIPTRSGAVWLRCAPDAAIEAIMSDGAPAVGGAAELGGRALVPVCGEVGVHIAVCGPGRTWSTVMVENAPRDLRGPFANPCSVGQEVWWACAAGALRVSAVTAGVFAEFRAWPADFSPILAMRSTRGLNGRLHQLGRAGGQPVFEAFAAPGEPGGRQSSNGIPVSCGTSSFREGRRYNLPWETARGSYQLEVEQFVAPLLAFSEDRFLLALCSPRLLLRRFVGDGSGKNNAAVEKLECRIAWSAGARHLVELGLVIHAASLHENAAFVFREGLFVYDASQNACWRWPLEVTDLPRKNVLL